MGQRSRTIDINKGIVWLLAVLGILSLIILILLIVSSLIRRSWDDPEALKYFSSDFLVKAAQYNRFNLIASAATRTLTWIFMAACAWLGYRYFSGGRSTKIYIAAGYIALFYIIINIIILPLSYYSGYVMEHSYGLSNQTEAMWFSDLAKEKGIEVLFSVTAFTGIYALLKYIPKYWWLIAASVTAIFLILQAYLYPVVIDPLFYNFKSLEDEGLREQVLEVTDKAGIEVYDILVADASRRTVKANAYFTGFFNTRRIVLYDNLLNNFSEDEILNVVAHEAGHWRYSHLVKYILIRIAASFIGFFALDFFLVRWGLRGSFSAIFLIILIMSFMAFLTAPVLNAVSRHFERQADSFALHMTGEYDAHISLLADLAESNLLNVDPGPVITAVLYSHPTVMERIRAVEAVREPE